jgi:hypothetical protein
MSPVGFDVVLACVGEGFQALPGDDGEHGEGGDGVGPPPPCEGVEADADEQGEG